MKDNRTQRGISFPFRIGVKGGVVMSSTSSHDVPHIEESMQQILSTNLYERTMEYHIFSDIDSDIFEPNDLSTRTLIAHQVKEALKLDPRIEVKEVFIESAGNTIYATVTYIVLAYDTSYTTQLKVGEY